MENVETGNLFAFERKLRGRSNTKQKEKLDNISPTACFTYSVSRMGTVLERVHVFYWKRMLVVSTVLQGTIEMELGRN